MTKRPASQVTSRWRRYQLKSQLMRSPFTAVPLLNVFLLILLFSVYGSAFVLKPGINVQLPVGAFNNGTYYDAMVVILSQEGNVFYNDECIPIESLGGAFRSTRTKLNTFQLTIEADQQVPYASIIRVLNMATAAGITNVYLSVRPSFGEEIMP
jgi:biopolymer transport protein ExbD